MDTLGCQKELTSKSQWRHVIFPVDLSVNVATNGTQLKSLTAIKPAITCTFKKKLESIKDSNKTFFLFDT